MCLFCTDDADESLNDHDDGSIKENFREQDIYLPIANVARIMKNAVPQTGKVSRGILTGLIIILVALFVLCDDKPNWCSTTSFLDCFERTDGCFITL